MKNSHRFDSCHRPSQSTAGGRARVLIAGRATMSLFLSGTALQHRIEGSGAKFRPLPAGADLDLRDILAVAPELKDIPPGPEWLHVRDGAHFCRHTVSTSARGSAGRNLPVDVIVADDMYFGCAADGCSERCRNRGRRSFLCGTSFSALAAVTTERHISPACRPQPRRRETRGIRGYRRRA